MTSSKQRIVIATLDFGGNPDPNSAKIALIGGLHEVIRRIQDAGVDARLFDTFSVELEQEHWDARFVIRLEQSDEDQDS